MSEYASRMLCVMPKYASRMFFVMANAVVLIRSMQMRSARSCQSSLIGLPDHVSAGCCIALCVLFAARMIAYHASRTFLCFRLDPRVFFVYTSSRASSGIAQPGPGSGSQQLIVESGTAEEENIIKTVQPIAETRPWI
jgi:hypothetical protein